MATDHEQREEADLLAARRANWSGFLRFSTFSIVAVSVVLIGMAVFLL